MATAGRSGAPSGGLPPEQYWSIGLVGTTWLRRGPAYWARRVAVWIGAAAGTAMTVAMTAGVTIGLVPPASGPVLMAAVITANLTALVWILAVSWPTPARIQARVHDRRTARGHGGRRPVTGIGTIIGMTAAGGSVLGGLVVVLLLLTCASGIFLASWLLLSLPRLPEEQVFEVTDGPLLARRRAQDRQ